jgi:TIR domain
MLVGAGLMADVFISYSKSYVQITRDLAADLEAKGLTVWWDTDLLAGESFRQRIIQELQACKAAIVIWTPHSVISDYVISEAERARKAGKLIQVRTGDIQPDELPPPFDTGHASLIDDRKAIYGALAKLGILRIEGRSLPSGPFPLFHPDKQSAVRKVSTRVLVIAGFAITVTVGALASIIWYLEQPSPVFHEASDPSASRISKVVNQFIDALNAGFANSSLFDAEVRLGRRGNMTRVEAVTDLRRFLSRYSKLNCRTDGSSPTSKSPELGRSGLRIKIYLVCDFVNENGGVTTEHFPIEIETTPDTLLITGLWHSEKMVLWQPRARD